MWHSQWSGPVCACTQAGRGAACSLRGTCHPQTRQACAQHISSPADEHKSAANLGRDDVLQVTTRILIFAQRQRLDLVPV